MEKRLSDLIEKRFDRYGEEKKKRKEEKGRKSESEKLEDEKLRMLS